MEHATYILRTAYAGGSILGIEFLTSPDILKIPFKFNCGDEINPGDLLVEMTSINTSAGYSGGRITFDPFELQYIGIVETVNERLILFNALRDGKKIDLPSEWYYGYFILQCEGLNDLLYFNSCGSPRWMRHDKSVKIKREA